MLYRDLILAGYCAAIGFVAAGALASFYQLVTDVPPRFSIALDTLWHGFLTLLLCAFCGPFIIMRNAIRGRMIERRPLGWLMASVAIAAGWSLCSGILVVEFALDLSHMLA